MILVEVPVETTKGATAMHAARERIAIDAGDCVSNLSASRDQGDRFHEMTGCSPVMRELFEMLRSVGPTSYPVLLLGASGVGKELAARAVHAESDRRHGPFVPVNCGALPDDLLESELFGHVRGAFTGAMRSKRGRFELADGGTLMLDEVGELSPSFQVKLLRVLQDGCFTRVGGERPDHTDVRILAATHRDLRTMVQQGAFREDLYFRLAAVPIRLPALHERTTDIPYLVHELLVQVRVDSGKGIHGISRRAMQCFVTYAWPGNIRELNNALQYASVRCRGSMIRARHLPPEITSGIDASLPRSGTPVVHPPVPGRGEKRPANLTTDGVRDAIQQCGGNKSQAARLLGVGRATLYRFITAHTERSSR